MSRPFGSLEILIFHRFYFLYYLWTAIVRWKDGGVVSRCIPQGLRIQNFRSLRLVSSESTLLFNHYLRWRREGFLSFPKGITSKVNARDYTWIWTRLAGSTFHADIRQKYTLIYLHYIDGCLSSTFSSI